MKVAVSQFALDDLFDSAGLNGKLAINFQRLLLDFW